MTMYVPTLVSLAVKFSYNETIRCVEGQATPHDGLIGFQQIIAKVLEELTLARIELSEW